MDFSKIDKEFAELIGSSDENEEDIEFLYYEYKFRKKDELDHLTSLAKKKKIISTFLSLKERKAQKNTSTTRRAAPPVVADEKNDSNNKLFTCRNCSSNDIIWTQKQIRSADEAMTLFFECQNCKCRWKQ